VNTTGGVKGTEHTSVILPEMRTRGRARRHLRHHRVKIRIPPVHRQPLLPEMGTCKYLSHTTDETRPAFFRTTNSRWVGCACAAACRVCFVWIESSQASQPASKIGRLPGTSAWEESKDALRNLVRSFNAYTVNPLTVSDQCKVWQRKRSWHVFKLCVHLKVFAWSVS
jgi:hypothetical protein